MKLDLGGRREAKQWLTSEDWLISNFGDGDFAQFLEYSYFEPGTPKNAEFETLILPEKRGISFWFRIEDTEENRENLKEALERFYGLVVDDIDKKIASMQREIKKMTEVMD